jgi:hypothetical protein
MKTYTVVVVDETKLGMVQEEIGNMAGVGNITHGNLNILIVESSQPLNLAAVHGVERYDEIGATADFVEGLRVRGEVVPESELKDHPADGVTHVETPEGEIKRVAFSAV